MNTVLSEFVQAHLDDDLCELALKGSRYPQIDMPQALVQIAGYQAIRQKVPQWYAYPDLCFPPKLSLEQASSETTAQYKKSVVERLLPSERRNLGFDLTGGLGVDTYYLSELFQQYVYVEQQESLSQCARHNFDVLHRPQVQVRCGTAEETLRNIDHADFIYLDPARRDNNGHKVFALQDCSPDLTLLLPLLREKCSLLMLKLSPMLDISQTLAQLGNVDECHVLALDNDCKELLMVLHFDGKDKDTRLYTRNFRHNASTQCFDCFRQEERTSQATLLASDNPWFKNASLPDEPLYLYEPNAALMKAGTYKLLSQRYGLLKLHQHTHLYLSDRLVDGFPGRIFRLVEILAPSSKASKLRLQQLSKANLACRNYPETVEALRKKYRLKEGGQNYIFAVTLADNQRLFLLCEKI